jgi:hypothetical protein
MEAVSPQTEELIADKVSKHHHRPIVIGDGSHPPEGPNVGGKDFLQVPEAADVGIQHHLAVVVIDKTVEQNVEIRQSGAGDEGGD